MSSYEYQHTKFFVSVDIGGEADIGLILKFRAVRWKGWVQQLELPVSAASGSPVLPGTNYSSSSAASC